MPPPRGRRGNGPAGPATPGWVGRHLGLVLLLAWAAAAADADPPSPTKLPPPVLCKTPGAAAPDMALLAAYAPFADPGMGWGDTLLPLISIKPRSVDAWLRNTPLFCAVTPDAPAAGGAAGAHPPASPLILAPATTHPHVNSHKTTQMAAFHWCRLTRADMVALGGRGGTVRLVDAPTATALADPGADGGRAAAAAQGGGLACEGEGVRFPPPLAPPHPPPGQAMATVGDAYLLTAADGADTSAVTTTNARPPPAGHQAGGAGDADAPAPAAPPPPPPPTYETLAACVGPLYGDAAWGLAAWFEHHRDAGVGHFYLYSIADAWGPAANPVHAVLAHYAAAGLATLVDWAPVGGPASPWAAGAWYFNQAALHNDCLNRARGVHRHVVFMDTDEYVDASGWKARGWVAAGREEGEEEGKGEGEGEGEGGAGAAAPPATPSSPPPPLDASSGAFARAVAAWAASPAYEVTHSIAFACRWVSMLGDAATRRQLTARDGLSSDPADEPELEQTRVPALPASLTSHPPLAPTACTEPLLDRLPYRAADIELSRSKFVARPDVALSVEAHYVIEGAGDYVAFASAAVHHNHYYMVRDGPAAHPTAPRPAGAGGPGAAASLAVPVPGMTAVLDPTWPARFVDSGLRARTAAAAAAACGGL